MTILAKIFSPVASLQEKPGAHPVIGQGESQMLHGEYFAIQSSKKNWHFGTSILDSYVGWIEDVHVTTAKFRPTHIVTARNTNAYPAPDFKSRPEETFHFMSRVSVDTQVTKGGFVILDDYNLWVPAAHLIPIDTLAQNKVDIVETATMFSGSPYLFGGRTASGIDCSGLVQISLQRNGIACPRDCDQQEQSIGVPVPVESVLKRGDLVYFKGHVAIMLNENSAINATARHMQVVTEPLIDLKAFYGEPVSIRRLTP